MEQSHPGLTTRNVSFWPGILVVGDLISFFLFAWIGRRSHAEAAGLAAFWETLATAAPFMVAWFLIAPWLGAFRRDTFASPQLILTRTALAWLCAWPVGLGLRALFLQRGIPLSFALVTGATNLVMLTAWRGVFAWLNRRA
jgi:hypothetical protein